VVIHIERREGRRFLSHVLQIEHFDAEANRYNATTLYQA
jgi:hypothetical protein